MKLMRQAYSLFLVYLRDIYPALLDRPIEESLTLSHFKNFCRQIGATNSPVSIASTAGKLYMTVRYVVPDHDWEWLRSHRPTA